MHKALQWTVVTAAAATLVMVTPAFDFVRTLLNRSGDQWTVPLQGEASAHDAPDGGDRRITFRLLRNDERELQFLEFEFLNARERGLSPLRFPLEVGQDHVLAAYPLCLDGGYFIVIESGYGAGSLRTIVLSIRHGSLVSHFDKVSRFGSQILDVTGDGVPDICFVSGDNHAPSVTTDIYCWDGQRFAIKETMKTTHPHRYAVRRKNE